ncbi:MAG: histidine phosphatase family protein [Muribaculaceae bacterium]|nr:histidine phosphatase family protein [Muribaculaceae bacterium]
MRKLAFTLILLLGFISGSATFTPLPPELDGSMMPYDFEAEDSLLIPEGYTPVHISYVARHGARYLSSPKKTEKIERALEKGASEGILSVEGEKFLAFLKEITAVSKGRWGLLSEVGIAEQRRLGSFIGNSFPELLKRGKAVSISTFVPRVIMTMYEFNHSLEIPNHQLELFTSSGHQNDSLLYCFATFRDYSGFRESGAWVNIYDSYVGTHVSPLPAGRLFKPGTENDTKRLLDLTMEMYGVLQGNRAASLPAPTTEWFSEEEYRQCYLASNLKHYLRNTPNLIDPWCAPATSMLLERIISDADKALADGDTPFNGYFGHCETLLPLLAVMNIPGCYLRTSDYSSVESHWRLQEISPLGANLQLIFLRKGNRVRTAATGEVSVMVRLNGRHIAPYPGAPKIVTWKDLKDYWLRRIASFSRPKAKIL